MLCRNVLQQIKSASLSNNQNFYNFSIIKKLSGNEESAMINKEVCLVLKTITPYIPIDVTRYLFQIFEENDNDSIRIPLMDIAVSISTNFGAEHEKYILDCVAKLSNDISWRVRLTVADKICEIVTKSKFSKDAILCLVEIYGKLFEDTEAEVRNTCCNRLEEFAMILGKEDIFENILKQVQKVEKDTVNYVRGTLASNLLKICVYIGKTKTNDHVFPIFLNLIQDESHDIRMTLIKNLDKLNEVISIDMILQSIVPRLVEISNNQSWRIRIQITEAMPVMAKVMV